MAKRMILECTLAGIAACIIADTGFAGSCRSLPTPLRLTVPAANFTGNSNCTLRNNAGTLQISCGGGPFSNVGSLTGVICIQADLGTGDDTLIVNNTVTTMSSIDGGDGRDTITCQGGPCLIHGRDGADVLTGGPGRDTIIGGSNIGTMITVETINGGGGNDVLDGVEGIDNIDGGTGGDRIYGGLDADNLVGGAGSDWVYGEEGVDAYDCGTSADLAQDDSFSGSIPRCAPLDVSDMSNPTCCEFGDDKTAAVFSVVDPIEYTFTGSTLSANDPLVDVVAYALSEDGILTLEFSGPAADTLIEATVTIGNMTLKGIAGDTVSFTDAPITVQRSSDMQTLFAGTLQNVELNTTYLLFEADINVTTLGTGLGSDWIDTRLPCMVYRASLLGGDDVQALLTSTANFTQNGSAIGALDVVSEYGPGCIVGGCVTSDGSCGLYTMQDCQRAGATYLGNNVPCPSTPCADCPASSTMGLLTVAVCLVVGGALLFRKYRPDSAQAA